MLEADRSWLSAPEAQRLRTGALWSDSVVRHWLSRHEDLVCTPSTTNTKILKVGTKFQLFWFPARCPGQIFTLVVLAAFLGWGKKTGYTSRLNKDRVMNGFRLQKTSDTKLYLVNWTITIITREKEARGLDGVQYFLAFSPALGQQRYGFLNPVLWSSTA